MSPIRLQNKIERLLAELYENCPKKRHKSKYQSWTNWIGTKRSYPILKKYKASYLSEGASRLAVEIVHAGKNYVFKICHTRFADEVLCGKFQDDNHVEIAAVKRLKKSIWTRSLVLPMVLHYYSEIAGWISVWPKGQDYELYNNRQKNIDYNEIREGMITELSSDFHDVRLKFKNAIRKLQAIKSIAKVIKKPVVLSELLLDNYGKYSIISSDSEIKTGDTRCVNSSSCLDSVVEASPL